jgi:hypothetical protein
MTIDWTQPTQPDHRDALIAELVGALRSFVDALDSERDYLGDEYTLAVEVLAKAAAA